MASRRAQGGFVLAVTLWLLAGIAIVVALVTLWSLDQVQDAQRDRDQAEDQLALFSTRETVVYLAATRDMTVAGLPVQGLSAEQRVARTLSEFGGLRRDPVGGELRLDDSAYQGLGGTTFSVQDEAGLYPVVWPDAMRLDRLLETQGIADKNRARLRDALLDYVDEDSLRHLHGAEKREYERAGRPVPPNRRLLLPMELERVLGWDELPPQTLAALQSVTTTFYAGALNLNTAPASLLPTLINGCPRTCDTLMAQRRDRPFRSAVELQALLGVQLPGDDMVEYRFAPSDTLRLTVWGRTGAAMRIHVRLTPLADKRAPWTILAAYPVARPSLDDAPRPIDSALFADAETDRP